MAQVVKIELMVDEKGAVTGLRNLEQAGARVQTTIKSVGTAGTQAGKQLQQAFAAPGMDQLKTEVAATTASLQTMGTTSQRVHSQMSSHALTSLDSVRLFRDEFGIHIPRSMEKAMASSKAVMGALNAMQGAMLAVGAVGVVVALGKQFYDLYKDIHDATDEVTKFDRALSDAASKKFFDTAGLTTNVANLRSYQGEQASLEARQRNSTTHAAYWGTMVNPFASDQSVNNVRGKDVMSEEDQNRLKMLQEVTNSIPLKAEKERHANRMADLESESKAASAMIAGPAQNARLSRIANDRSREDAMHGVNENNTLVDIQNRFRNPKDAPLKPIDANGPNPDLQNALEINKAEAAAKSIQWARQVSEEQIKLNNEATNAALKGEQLLEAQRTQAIADYERKYVKSITAVAAINRRFDEEESERLKEMTREVEKRSRASMLAGQTGVAAIQQRGANRLADIDDDLAAGKYFGTDSEQHAQAAKDKVSAQRDTDAELVEEQKRFAQQVDELAATSAERQVAGFARIRAEGDKELQALQRRFEEMYGGIKDKTSPLYQSGLAELGRGKSAISSSTNSQITDLAQKNADETAKIEREAAAKSLPQMRQREQEIRDQYADRLAAYTRMLQQQEISDDDYRRRSAAAEREMNAQLAAEAKQQRDRLAGMIEPFFKNPKEALQRMGEQQASKFAADMVMKLNGGSAPGVDGGKHDLFGALLPGSKHHKAASPQVDATNAMHAVQTLSVQATNVYINGGMTSAPTSSGIVMPSSVSSSTASFAAPLAASGGRHLLLPDGSVAQGLADDSASSGSAASIMGGGSSQPFTVADAKSAMAAQDSAAGPAPISSDINFGLNTAKQAQQLGSQLFGKDGLNNPQMTQAMGNMGKGLAVAGPGISGAAGMFSAYESNGGIGGALTGAMGGAQLGSYFGPIGTGVGAAAGAIIGFIGFGGEQKAREYYDKKVKPRISSDVLQFGQGSMDYQAASDDLIALNKEARQATKQWGMGGKREWNDHIKPDIDKAIQNLDREQKAGRSQYGVAASQFHGGGSVLGFGDFATGPNEGFAHLKVGETVMHERASATHGDALDLMLAGANRQQMASYYGGGAASMASAFVAAMSQGSFGNSSSTTNNNGHTYISALDAKSVGDLLMANRHSVRAATNASYAENSGGWD